MKESGYGLATKPDQGQRLITMFAVMATGSTNELAVEQIEQQRQMQTAFIGPYIRQTGYRDPVRGIGSEAAFEKMFAADRR